MFDTNTILHRRSHRFDVNMEQSQHDANHFGEHVSRNDDEPQNLSGTATKVEERHTLGISSAVFTVTDLPAQTDSSPQSVPIYKR
jgi:hypothetical protein